MKLRGQGLGSPACARILTSWYPDRERGTFWGFWTASNNIGGFLAPIIAGNAAAHYGWRCNPDLVTSLFGTGVLLPNLCPRDSGMVDTCWLPHMMRWSCDCIMQNGGC